MNTRESFEKNKGNMYDPLIKALESVDLMKLKEKFDDYDLDAYEHGYKYDSEYLIFEIKELLYLKMLLFTELGISFGEYPSTEYYCGEPEDD